MYRQAIIVRQWPDSPAPETHYWFEYDEDDWIEMNRLIETSEDRAEVMRLATRQRNSKTLPLRVTERFLRMLADTITFVPEFE